MSTRKLKCREYHVDARITKVEWDRLLIECPNCNIAGYILIPAPTSDDDFDNFINEVSSRLIIIPTRTIGGVPERFQSTLEEFKPLEHFFVDSGDE